MNVSRNALSFRIAAIAGNRKLLPASATMLSLAAVLLLAGCSTARVTHANYRANEKFPRPKRILVYNFAATPADVPPDSPLALRAGNASLPPEQVDLGRQLGAAMASQLIAEIREMGMPAEQGIGTSPDVNDIIVRGYLVSLDEGSAMKRFTIGFGSGASELTTIVEGYQMTPRGLRQLGTGTATSAGSKGPGTAASALTFAATGNPAGLIVSSGLKVYGETSGRSKVDGRARLIVGEIANRLEKRFKEQGWIE